MKQIKVVVKKRFLDRYTGVFHNPGEVLTISEKRYLEIKNTGNYIEVEKKSKVEKVEKAPTEIKK